MVILILFLAAAARAAVVPFPPRDRQVARVAAREVLRLRRAAADEELARAARSGSVATARVVLEEINAAIARAPGVIPPLRVEAMLNALLELPEAAAIGPERAALRDQIELLYNGVARSARLEPVLGLAVRFKAFEPADVLAIDLARARRAFLRRWYFLIAASARALGAPGRDEVARRLLVNTTEPLLRFALLDEIDRLPVILDAMVLRLLRHEFTPRPGRVIAREARVIHLHLLERWQERIVRGDPRARAAANLVAKDPGDAPARAFARGLAEGRLPTDRSDARLRARDPLRLDCSVRLINPN